MQLLRLSIEQEGKLPRFVTQSAADRESLEAVVAGGATPTFCASSAPILSPSHQLAFLPFQPPPTAKTYYCPLLIAIPFEYLTHFASTAFIMRVAAVILSLLTATAVSSRSLFGSSQNALVDEPKNSVPGKNPLNVCLTFILVELYAN